MFSIEFKEAFQVFSKNGTVLGRDELPLFLK